MTDSLHMRSWFALLLILHTQSVLPYGPIWDSTSVCTAESTTVQTCFSLYLERDISEVHGFVYPDKDQSLKSCSHISKPRMQVEAPALVSHCGKIWDVYNCVLEELNHCRLLVDFFNLRHVLYSMEKSIRSFCGAPMIPGQEMTDKTANMEAQHNFPALLGSLHCLECHRLSENIRGDCVASNEINRLGDEHLWLKILRLEMDPEICSDLERQHKCFQDKLKERQLCRHVNLTEAYNLFPTFIHTWCDNPLRPSASTKNIPNLYLNPKWMSFVWIFLFVVLL